MKSVFYESHVVVIVFFDMACGFCQSGTEGLGENDGNWDFGIGSSNEGNWD